MDVGWQVVWCCLIANGAIVIDVFCMLSFAENFSNLNIKTLMIIRVKPAKKKIGALRPKYAGQLTTDTILKALQKVFRFLSVPVKSFVSP
ncbi:hypothetical protein Y032_0190g1253 [Ancylostoma ceylanicum]|uniref:Uncharacterized protein n=1 Tax=Ancylostoma ceylanicum TaxID=53326 RepID=A0A016SQT7_9BILA|nr:hypothetical protein Y032_0190g1253 [Ancylostoma ceylanicum]